jgi:hypothetical protein
VVEYIQRRIRYKKTCRERRIDLLERYWEKVLLSHIMKLSGELNIKKAITITNKIIAVNKEVRRYLLDKFEDNAKLIRYIEYFQHRK